MSTTRAASESPAPVSILIVGCGAISELFHLPVLGGHPGFRIAGMVDRNQKQAKKLASQYGVRNVYSDVSQIPPGHSFDCALVATPPGVHAAIAIQLLEKKIPVLVEKPFSLSYAQACQVVEVARRSQTVLSAGYFRRLFPGLIALRQALASGRYGRPLSFFAQEGCFFDWPSLTMGSMRKESAGGGVLIDTGSHLVDQVLSLFDFDQFEIRRFLYDAWGADAIEAQAKIDLTTKFQGQPVPGTIRLSRIADWPAEIAVLTDQGLLIFEIGKRDEAAFYPNAAFASSADLLEILNSGVDADPEVWLTLQKRLAVGGSKTILSSERNAKSFVEIIRLDGVESPDIFSTFWTEWEDFRLAVTGQKEPTLSGTSVLPAVRLIDACYQLAQSGDSRASVITPGWMTERFPEVKTPQTIPEQRSNGPDKEPLPTQQSTQSRGADSERVLITGATGFIGCRMAEILSRTGYQVRALVHSAAKAGRLMRLAGDIEIVEGDLMNKKSLKAALQDCQSVIHCAYGTALERKAALAATVKGTLNIAQLCRKESVRRFIYCSTLAVNGTDRFSPLSPGTQISPDQYDYAAAKAKAERHVQKEIDLGLKGIVFRLGNVYGPFSAPWTIRILNQIKAGFPVLYEDGANPSNTIYVDNVVEAARCALKCPEEAVGKTYVLADSAPNWQDFYQPYADALGLPMRRVTQRELGLLRKQSAKNWLNLVPRAGRSLLEILKGEPLKKLLIQFITNDPLGTVPRWIFYECPGVRPFCRVLLGLNRPDLYFAPSLQNVPKLTGDDANLFNIYACQAPADDSQTRLQLSYAPAVSQEEAMRRTLDWARESGLI